MAFSSLLSKHGLALLCVARNPDSSLRDMADFVGVTGRAGHTLVSDLCEAGYGLPGASPLAIPPNQVSHGSV